MGIVFQHQVIPSGFLPHHFLRNVQRLGEGGIVHHIQPIGVPRHDGRIVAHLPMHHGRGGDRVRVRNFHKLHRHVHFFTERDQLRHARALEGGFFFLDERVQRFGQSKLPANAEQGERPAFESLLLPFVHGFQGFIPLNPAFIRRACHFTVRDGPEQRLQILLPPEQNRQPRKPGERLVSQPPAQRILKLRRDAPRLAPHGVCLGKSTAGVIQASQVVSQSVAALPFWKGFQEVLKW